jgi:hypothetical protein
VGEIAEMMLDGTMCEGCGEFMNIGGEPAGYPVRCAACGEEPDATEPVNYIPKRRRVKCECGKGFRTAAARDQHRRDKHG